jgi:hypothetical protein
LPSDFFPARQNEFISALKGKTGGMELQTTETDVTHTKLKLKYTYETGDKSGKHLLDLINALYVVTK